ncbi:aspartate aminotransferase, putative [Entamoeba invadens IP1]|uniref:Aspartate aminotransferase, putative n=1 Tax=Entamoeba invadens IP1 TaxID=370355 RepID=A0A0A1UGF2_ENTIV|nr:aspartate aminotransferase, putative [Entamoeba invadens IP1]ELP94849.1 aspartate aminotransferase, putative [Entamoeba invadens IP1]|eukprot:XP_004261620.1 aspartate aminotransferase, putative [Entamoeba invadens IP1]
MLCDYYYAKCAKGTAIRKMSALSRKLKNEKGESAIIDLTLGNPLLPPPEVYQKALEIVSQNTDCMRHGYSTTLGDTPARQAMADIISSFEKVLSSAENVVLTPGCTAAINVFLRSVLNPRDEVILFSPYFLEYPFYIDNCQATMKIVRTKFEENWQPNAKMLEESLTEKTKVIIINSPNNPTGVVYTEETMVKIVEVLKRYNTTHNHKIWILNDSVYRRLIEGDTFTLFDKYQYSAIAYSLSKDVSIPGERVGCIAVNPLLDTCQEFVAGIANFNEILGFMQPNRLHQFVLPIMELAVADLKQYVTSREIICECLEDLGIKFVKPHGAFYFFPKIEEGNEEEFCHLFAMNGVVVVPGSAFGECGYFRMSICQPPEIVRGWVEQFKECYRKTVHQLKEKTSAEHTIVH